MTARLARKETAMTVHPDRQEAATTVHHDPTETAASTAVQEGEPSTTQVAAPPGRAGDPRALLVARLLAAAALVVTAFIHGRLAVQLGVSGPLLSQGRLFAAQAALSAFLAVAMLTRDNRIWLVAVVLSAAGLGAILASVYFPVPALGPFPAINEPVWLMTKAVCAFAEASVLTLWLVRQIAPPK